MFISSFKNRVNYKVLFDVNMRMERLISVLEGETKRFMESIGYHGIFYVTALKSLNRDFGNPILASYLKIKTLLDQPRLKVNDKTSFPHFHLQIKTTNTWLISTGYQNPILSYEILSKAGARLPHYLRAQFFRATHHWNLTTTQWTSFHLNTGWKKESKINSSH